MAKSKNSPKGKTSLKGANKINQNVIGKDATTGNPSPKQSTKQRNNK